MTDLAAQAQIMDRLRQIAGGPRSLRFAPAPLQEGLCMVVGRTAALTLRSVDEVMGYLGYEYERAPRLELAQASDFIREAEPRDIAACLSVGLMLPPLPKTSSHLALGAFLGLLAQLARARGVPLDALRAPVAAAHASVSASTVDEFQRAAAVARGN